jgi:hypothetical protein
MEYITPFRASPSRFSLPAAGGEGKSRRDVILCREGEVDNILQHQIGGENR